MSKDGGECRPERCIVRVTWEVGRSRFVLPTVTNKKGEEQSGNHNRMCSTAQGGRSSMQRRASGRKEDRVVDEAMSRVRRVAGEVAAEQKKEVKVDSELAVMGRHDSGDSQGRTWCRADGGRDNGQGQACCRPDGGWAMVRVRRGAGSTAVATTAVRVRRRPGQGGGGWCGLNSGGVTGGGRAEVQGWDFGSRGGIEAREKPEHLSHATRFKARTDSSRRFASIREQPQRARRGGARSRGQDGESGVEMVG